MSSSSAHDIVIVIPVADRPQHLAECLRSLQELRRRYPYAGAVSVLVADDSRDADSLEQHRALAEQCSNAGLPVHHLGQAEQRALVAQLPGELQAQLQHILGDASAATFHHKGASITRNIAYLWLNRLAQDGRKRLFWFLDSDQEFRVNLATAQGEELCYAIDYFNDLDRIFTATPTRILTGKVVGDPPVSPAVMAGNFLDDVLAFLAALRPLPADTACTFHDHARHADDAAYHDMADLFGFKAQEAFRYQCSMSGAHDHAACLADFASRLGRFFDGEHPTRRSVYEPAELSATIQPARTIYTGNYVFSAESLDYFIPFAALKLRMAGPTLGRIIKAEQGTRFVSANLPMLHKRTVDAIGQSEFRPGIERASTRVDLSGEFERQYFGDVMLFSIERLTAQGYPGTALVDEAITAMVARVEAEMHDKYTLKHQAIVTKLAQLSAAFNAPDAWWQQEAALTPARELFLRFLENMQHNFGDESRGWQIINDTAHREGRKAAISAAIAAYAQERAAWCAALASGTTP